MALSSIAIGSLVAVGIAAVLLLIVALERSARPSLILASGNVRGAAGRTVLIILGLLVGTTIISASLVVNDTVGAVDIHYALQNYGYIDEGIYNQTASGTYQPFPSAVYANLSAELAGDRRIAGIAPEAIGTTQAFDTRTGVPETNLDLIGANGNQTSAQGPFTTDQGTQLPGPSPGEVLLDDQAAGQLGARTGDVLELYGPTGVTENVTVQGIVHDDTRGGIFYLYLGAAGNVFIDLAGAQRLLGLSSGAINFIAVTNPGGQTQGAANSGNISRLLNASLAAVHAPPSLAAHPLLLSAVNAAVASGQSTATFFLLFGLFSIVAGAILVVTIFVMLAEERKGEMGTLRAIGLRRGQLVRVYLFEGVVYAAGSAVAGTFVGVGVGYAMAWLYANVFASGEVGSSAVLSSFTFTPSSLVTAFSIGFLLTLITVVVASYRVSRLNIVRAIRSIPEPPPTAREYTRLAFVGAPVAVFGGILFAATHSGTSDASLPEVGMLLLILGSALVAARFFRNRPVFSVAGLLMVIWGGALPLRSWIDGTKHTDTTFAFFSLGILLILGAVLLYVFNARYLVEGLTWLFGGSSRRVAIANTGLAYPGRRPVRPALTLSIFTLVVFVVVAVAGFGAAFEADLDRTIADQTGGYSYFATFASPVDSLAQEVHNNSTLRSEFSAVVPLLSGGAYLVYAGVPASAQFGYSVDAAPIGLPDTSAFYTTNQFSLMSSVNGTSSAATWAELATDPTGAIVDGDFGTSGLGSGNPPLAPGQRLTVVNPVAGTARNLTVLGVMTGSLLPGVWLDPATMEALGYRQVTAAFLSLAPGASDTSAAQGLKRAFFADGLVLYDFSQILGEVVHDIQAIFSLLELFAAIGLAVGIAAMGIIALRAVGERKREIGMERATGFTQADVFYSFLLEYSFIALLGIALGVALGTLLDWEAAGVPSNGLVFVIPWTAIALIASTAYGLVLLAVAGPALRAARLPPSVATRYVE